MATSSQPGRSFAQRSKPAGNLELQLWFFMRASGLALMILAVTHWTIMHFMHRLSELNAGWIVARYQNVLWPTFDALMLLFALAHGTNGLRYIIDDYVRNKTWNLLAKSVLYMASTIFIILGLIVIFMIPGVKAPK